VCLVLQGQRRLHLGWQWLHLSAAGYADNQWHMVTFTVDSSGGKLYVDGALKKSRAWTGVAGTATTNQVLSFAAIPA